MASEELVCVQMRRAGLGGAGELGMQAEGQSEEPTCRGRVDAGKNKGPTGPRSQRQTMDPEEESGEQVSRPGSGP